MTYAMRSDARRSRLAQGFTLIEIMVVVLIIAIMAALIVPRVLNQQAQAKVTAAQADLSTLSGALQQFRLNCDRYPSQDEGLNALLTAPSDLQGKWKGPYLEKKQIPNDPWGNSYQYTYPGSGGNDTFDLFSYGPSGHAGGTGDDSAIYADQ